MKTFYITLFSVFFAFVSFAQKLGFTQLLDSGKNEYRRQFSEVKSDFSKCYTLFEQAVLLQPNSAEARYWLGHAIDKINMADGSTLNRSTKELTVQASEQFERVIKLEKKYKGEIFNLDPYSKLTAIWGSLALAYLIKKEKDSALWAYAEGRRRGAFNDAILEFNRQLLESCTPNAILLCQGDNITLPIYYLQEVEDFRKDVSIVDVNLGSTNWYNDFIRRTATFKFTYEDPELDSLGFREWAPQEQIIINENNKQEFIKWTLKPTYYQNYVLKSDLVLLDIFKNNFFKRDFYYSGTNVDSSMGSLHLDAANYITLNGVICKVVRTPNVSDTAVLNIPPALKKYNIDNVSQENINNSPDVLSLFNQMRYAYLVYVWSLLDKQKFKEAKELWSEMEQKFFLSKLPLVSELNEPYKKLRNATMESKRLTN
ncbi:MAG: hypothetical protein Q8941_23895 [Bacteroidota bacterium]|nr:hypothetical protein [Bacteroidota bacterium]